ITPMYFIVLGFYSTLFPYLGSGPVWPTYNTNPVCKENWMWHVLFINNFNSHMRQCLTPTWYLACEMQLYIISPIFLILLMRDKLNELQNIFKKVSEKKSSNAQDKDDFSNLKADILLLYIEAVSFVVPDGRMASDHSGTIMDLFIELKNEFASFRHDIYNKVDGFSKLLSPSTDSIQSDEPVSHVSPSLQQEILEAVVKSKDSTYASVAQSTSALPEGQSKVISRVVKGKKTNSKVVLNGAGKNSNLEIVGKMPKRKAIFLSRLGPSTTVNDITNYLSSLKLQYLQCNRLKTKFQSYASFHIEVYECDLQLLLDASFWPYH
ncbi:hypothetical protein AVEN_26899-1, partial [Araneus ventricosus]